jgi:hypothetical protein
MNRRVGSSPPERNRQIIRTIGLRDPASSRHVSREAEDRSLLAEPLLQGSHSVKSRPRQTDSLPFVAQAAMRFGLLLSESPAPEEQPPPAPERTVLVFVGERSAGSPREVADAPRPRGSIFDRLVGEVVLGDLDGEATVHVRLDHLVNPLVPQAAGAFSCTGPRTK